MNPAGIFLVWIFLAMLIILGVILAIVGGVKLRQRIHLGFEDRGSVTAFSIQSIIFTLGLLFISYGGFTLIQFIWNS